MDLFIDPPSPKPEKVTQKSKRATKKVSPKSIDKSNAIENFEDDFNSGAFAISAIGKKCSEVIKDFLPKIKNIGPLLGSKINIEKILNEIADSLKNSNWSDEKSAELIIYLFNLIIEEQIEFDLNNLARWINSHPNKPEEVFSCMGIAPPDNISIIKVLSDKGSQKKVFLATWALTQRQVVLKTVKGTSEMNEEEIKNRELQSHPLSIKHPNIIETHHLQNKRGEVFLIEELLPEVLNDDWRSNGVNEAVNLLYDISNALVLLHDLQLIHGDIKPDNIGKKFNSFILLDFGICRSIEAFEKVKYATGSLRTRAPELIITENYVSADPTKVDIWALGATVFNSILGRFPLYEVGESPPRSSKPDDREHFEGELKKRVENEWNDRVVFDQIHDPLKNVLALMLEKDPVKRPNAKKINEIISKDLSAFIRTRHGKLSISPLDEIKQLYKFLPNESAIKLMPENRKKSLIRHLQDLQNNKSIKNDQLMIETILNKLTEEDVQIKN